MQHRRTVTGHEPQSSVWNQIHIPPVPLSAVDTFYFVNYIYYLFNIIYTHKYYCYIFAIDFPIYVNIIFDRKKIKRPTLIILINKILYNY